MRKKVFWILAVAAMLFVMPAHASVATFNSDSEGFYTSYFNGFAFSEAASTWLAPGGNPGGHISGGLFESAAQRLYAFAKYGTASFGNLSGQTLSADYRIDGTVTSPASAFVRFYIGNYTGSTYNYWVTTDAYSWTPDNGAAWATHAVSMLESNWVKWPNQNANSMTWAQILSQYNDIGLVFTGGSNSLNNNAYLGIQGAGTVGIDNFGTAPVPIPAAAWLLGSGLLGLVAIRRRFSK